MDEEKKPTYKRLCRLAEKTAANYNAKGYDARALKFPMTKRVQIIIDTQGDDDGQTK